MDITIEQINEAKAGKPVRLEIPGHGVLYLVNPQLYEKLTARTPEADSALDAFLHFAAGEADEIATDNPY